MATSNKTPNYNLPQWVSSDLTSWMGDLNPAFDVIDTALQANKEAAATAAQNATQANLKAENAGNAAASAAEAAVTAQSAAQTAQTAANTANAAAAAVGASVSDWEPLEYTLTDIDSYSMSENTVYGSVSVLYNKALKVIHVVAPLKVTIKDGSTMPNWAGGVVMTITPPDGMTLPLKPLCYAFGTNDTGFIVADVNGQNHTVQDPSFGTVRFTASGGMRYTGTGNCTNVFINAYVHVTDTPPIS